MINKLICEKCGKEFNQILVRSNGYTARFCSSKCRNKEKIEIECLNCKQPFEIVLYRLGQRKYCSRKCMASYMVQEKSPNWRGGVDPSIYLKSDWRKMSRKIIERDNYTCQLCGITKDEATLEVNHIIPFRLIQSHNPVNLVTLCKKCHARTDWQVRDLLNMPHVRWRFLEIVVEMWKINMAKSGDYALAEDPLSNLKLSEGFGIPAWKGVLIRISDKFSRITQLARKGSAEIKDESITDTLLDLAVYCVLCIILYEIWRKKK